MMTDDVESPTTPPRETFAEVDRIELEVESAMMHAWTAETVSQVQVIGGALTRNLRPLFMREVADNLERAGGSHPLIDLIRVEADRLLGLPHADSPPGVLE